MNKILVLLIVLLVLLIIGLLLNKESIEGLTLTSSPYTAVIIEPRKHKALEFVLTNFMTNLNSDWDFVIFHGTENQEFIEDIINTKLSEHIPRITMVNMGVKNLTREQYSLMFYDETMYKYIPTEVFLIFQTDSMIFAKNKDKINDFLQYDYVGAPWPKDSGGLHAKAEVGNGGLSLRRKSKMLELLSHKDTFDKNLLGPNIEYYYLGKYPVEDLYFCGYLTPTVTVNKPDFNKAKEFSIEAIINDEPFGVHQCWSKYNLKTHDLKMLIDKYPELNTLISLNN
jgi:hypothetical protein